jgi:CheY-like chemotaxis protein
MSSSSPPFLKTVLLRPVLLIDDSHDDLFITKRLLARAGVKHPIVTVDGGAEAIVFLRASALQGAEDLLPCIIFCDVRMPIQNGFDVLTWARKHKQLKNVPFFMLSGGDTDGDRARAAELGATGYLIKFPPPDDFVRLIPTNC